MSETASPSDNGPGYKSGTLLRELAIVGYDALEPVLLGALATELPLLLIGPHGTAKSQLLNWLAEALGIEHRHYNAAMINFDDLVGFPFPNEARTSLDYIPTPSSIWGAESVFVDEISRTRLDMQNRLFPIIHERCLMGIPLADLRFRWAAMNPPASDDAASDQMWSYQGSESLDVALADRFPFVITLPEFRAFAVADQVAIITGQPAQPALRARQLLTQLIDATKAALATLSSLDEPIGRYVHALLPLLEKMKRPVSPRRAHMLFRVIKSVIAANLISGSRDPKPVTFQAISSALPHPAYGQPIDATALLAAHNQAWKLAEIPASDPKRLIFAESDPVRRVSIALQVGLGDIDLSTLIQDAYAGLTEMERTVFAVTLYPIVSTTKNLTASVFELLATEWLAIEQQSSRRHAITTGSRRHRDWQQLADWVADQAPSDPLANIMVNTGLVLFEREVDFVPTDLERQFRTFQQLLPWQKERTQ